MNNRQLEHMASAVAIGVGGVGCSLMGLGMLIGGMHDRSVWLTVFGVVSLLAGIAAVVAFRHMAKNQPQSE